MTGMEQIQGPVPSTLHCHTMRAGSTSFLTGGVTMGFRELRQQQMMGCFDELPHWRKNYVCSFVVYPCLNYISHQKHEDHLRVA